MPAAPSTPPPASTVDRYKVLNVTSSGSSIVGKLFRQSVQNLDGSDKLWFDHWALFSAYQAPKIGGVRVKLEPDPATYTFTQFLNQPPNTKYALVELEWNP
ncbi:MAG: hypothetical protein R3F59_38375 [Myxococcota bacterium]